MTTAAKIAIKEYRALCALQARMPADQQWTMGKAIKAAKVRAYVELEARSIK